MSSSVVVSVVVGASVVDVVVASVVVVVASVVVVVGGAVVVVVGGAVVVVVGGAVVVVVSGPVETTIVTGWPGPRGVFGSGTWSTTMPAAWTSGRRVGRTRTPRSLSYTAFGLGILPDSVAPPARGMLRRSTDLRNIPHS